MTTQRTFGTVGLFVLGMTALSPAIASAQSGPTARDPSTPMLEEIVVTAQRREQALQDVPLTVNALTATAIATMGVTSTTELGSAVPGLNIAPSVNAISPFIRGVGNTNTSPGDESATALYVDGVYISTLTAAAFALNNIERIEVLRGPQGTLFGRNATAGVIQIITRDPSEKTSGQITLGYGNYRTAEGSAYFTTGIAPNLAADLALRISEQNDGWGKNIVTGNDVYLGRDLNVRSKWRWTPSDATTVSFAIDYSETVPITTQAYSQLPGSVLFNGQRSAGLYNVQLETDVDSETKQWGANIQLRHDFGWAQGVSITSYRDVESRFEFDQDGTPVRRGYFTFNRGAETWTQEFQLLSPSGSRIQWILGAFYYHDDAYSLPSHLEGLVFGPIQINRFARQSARSVAVFGEATGEILPRTELTVGLRYTRDKRGIEGFDRNVLFGNTLPPSNIVNTSETFSEPTWRIALNHHFTDAVSAYASYNRGFKSGVYNVANQTQPAVRPAFVDAYEVGIRSELFDRRLRLNGSAFHNIYKDIQFQVSVLGGQQLRNAAKGVVSGIEIEADAAITSAFGMRGALSWQHSEYKSFSNAPFFIPTLPGGYIEVVGNAAGKDMIQAPPFTATVSANYAIPTSTGRFDLAGSLTYNDGFYFDAQNRIRQPSYTLLNGSVTWTSDGEGWSVRLWGRNLANEKYYAVVQPQTNGDTIVPAFPRTYGVSATRRF